VFAVSISSYLLHPSQCTQNTTHYPRAKIITKETMEQEAFDEKKRLERLGNENEDDDDDPVPASTPTANGDVEAQAPSLVVVPSFRNVGFVDPIPPATPTSTRAPFSVEEGIPSPGAGAQPGGNGGNAMDRWRQEELPVAQATSSPMLQATSSLFGFVSTITSPLSPTSPPSSIENTTVQNNRVASFSTRRPRVHER